MNTKSPASSPSPARQSSRRSFLKAASALPVAAYLGSGLRARPAFSANFQSPNEQPVVGFIGTGIRYHTYHCRQALKFGPCGGIADCDSVQLGRAQQAAVDIHRERDWPLVMGLYEDYRGLLDRSDIDVIVIGSVDHWHTKMVIDALKAGKDVYCEKPLTLTIREGQQIEQALQQTGRVMQVGTQQRTEFDQRFVQAAAMLRDGRVGDVQRLTVCIGGSRESGPLPKVDPPKWLNWELWQGQTPWHDYRQASEIVDQKGWGAGFPFSRAHRYYRWFYEYSGGKLTDWGAHHVDIAMWALDKLRRDIGPITIEPIEVVHPVEFKDGYPTQDDRFNCATKFKVKCTFADGIEMFVRDNAQDDLGFENGIMFEGTKGRFLVNRGKIVGRPVEELPDHPLPTGAYAALYEEPTTPDLGGFGSEGYHMKNFMECIKTRKTPASDVASHNRMLNVCHAINVAMRLGRTLTFYPENDTFGNDQQANAFIEREQRKGYEITV
ncbi:MAG: gfo/Idh/MocA family oxidoreductase [Planctomycetota bacterium]|nr:MAG: gfo/Idh/MocA family oxidoreductase [Planctomycetota bacterium]